MTARIASLKTFISREPLALGWSESVLIGLTAATILK